MKRLFVVVLLLSSSCFDGPKESLRKRGRPEPISCVDISDKAWACTDGAGVSWICDGRSSIGDSECIVTSSVPWRPESAR